jgi:D-3-phosphoglycerate dehydrogenase
MGKVAGAALDVFEEEPPHDNPLLTLPQVLVTPHLGASTIEAQENVAIDVSQEILNILRGQPFRNAVNLPSIPQEMLERVQPFFNLSEKLGSFVAQSVDGAPQEILITYSGDLSNFNISPLTRSFLKGLLTIYMGYGEVNYISAPHVAKLRHINVIEQKASQSKSFTNLIAITIKTTKETFSISGTLLEGFGPRIVSINDFSIDAQPEGHLLLVRHDDRPGVIGRVGTLLGQNDVNIGAMQVGRKGVGGNAIMILTVDREVPQEILDLLTEMKDVFSVKEIDL